MESPSSVQIDTQCEEKLELTGYEDVTCAAKIFNYEPLMKSVQMSRCFPDSKTFVDKKLKFPSEKIIKNFQDLLAEQNGAPISIADIKNFIDENFDGEGSELEPWLPEDWTPEPEFISTIRKPKLKSIARKINQSWRELSKKVIEDVNNNQDLYSLIYVPNGFVVNHVLSREFHYWDTYWIIRALLHCDMSKTVRGMIENFLDMVRTFGKVPQGNRFYYLNRSQPPMLCLMMREYWDKTNDVQFVRSQLTTLESEIEFWEKKRSRSINYHNADHVLFCYGSSGSGPRPEMFWEDNDQSQLLSDKETFYCNIKAASESGHESSSRWIISTAKESGEDPLTSIRTTSIIPVDLNSVMYLNYNCLSEFHSVLGDTFKSELYIEKARELKSAINTILWNDDAKMWFDYDCFNGRQQTAFHPSSLFPLWAECHAEEVKEEIAKSAVDYLEKIGSLDSGSHWGLPNSWEPLQQVLVAGLLKTGVESASKMALSIARKYTNIEMTKNTYNFQQNEVKSWDLKDLKEVYGLTNGTIIDFLVTFGDQLLSEENSVDNQSIYKFDHFNTLDFAEVIVHRASPEKHELEESEKSLYRNLDEDIEEDEPLLILQNSMTRGPLFAENSHREPKMSIPDSTSRLIDILPDQEKVKIYSSKVELQGNDEDLKRMSPLSSKSSISSSNQTRKLMKSDHGSRSSEVISMSYKTDFGSCNLQPFQRNGPDDVLVHFDDRKFDDQAKRNFYRSQEETISIRLKGNDVNVYLLDSLGHEVPVNDVDLELELPARFRSHSTLKSRVRNLLQRLRNLTMIYRGDESSRRCPDREKSVMYIKDKMRVRDSSGKEFDIEMDLKIEIQPTEWQADPDDDLPNSRFMCPMNVPWKNVWPKKQGESEKDFVERNDVFARNITKDSSLKSMDQLRLLELENNNFRQDVDERLWQKSITNKTASRSSGSIAELFKYTPV